MPQGQAPGVQVLLPKVLQVQTLPGQVLLEQVFTGQVLQVEVLLGQALQAALLLGQVLQEAVLLVQVLQVLILLQKTNIVFILTIRETLILIIKSTFCSSIQLVSNTLTCETFVDACSRSTKAMFNNRRRSTEIKLAQLHWFSKKAQLGV